ncbi:AAA family ATPase [Cyclobacterium jeungdonense]|uniref:SMC family ATPase n=1 Tax=Cyclobacterium jeungdonense TaxID=708087 RepID=A0ABT8C6W6_9BACT|nr:SMC family ATPase [Cyclobacterium jeungdonense]MDN3688101.1 SMC family ATPase [Cyclobacterium jeungdonense]
MIPVKLTLKGLYSYKETQTIDFTSLTAAGLFGIFGVVGSGKSSLLEAILLALYGSTERLSDRGEKNSMVNLQSDSLQISFEFKAGINNANHYLASYRVKRNPKNFDEIRPAEHHFYLKEKEELIPLEDRAETIIGMKMDHFKQTVIIPQGKFREFIDLTPGPRAAMMKELFGLERFDLSGNTGTLYKKAREEKIKLETKLEPLENLNPDLLEEQQSEWEKTRRLVQEKEQSFEKSGKKLQQMESFREKHQELLKSRETWEALENQLPEIEKKKKELKEYLQARTYLLPLWEKIKEENLTLEEATVGMIDCKRFEQAYKEQINTLEAQESDLKKKADQRPQREAKIRDLQKVLEIQTLTQELHTSQGKLESLQPQLADLLRKQESMEKQLDKLDKETESFDPSSDHQELAELQQQAKEWKTLLAQKEVLKRQEENLKKETRHFTNRVEELLASLPADFTDFDQWMVAQKEVIKKWELEREKLIEKKALQNHAHALRDGEPCPLCGSLEHPEPLDAHLSDDSLEKIQASWLNSREKLDQTQEITRELLLQRNNKEHHSEQLRNKSEELNLQQQQLDHLQKRLAARGIIDPESLDSKRKKLEEKVQQQAALDKTIREGRKNLEQIRKQREQSQNESRKAEEGLLSLKSTIQAKEEEISDLEFAHSYLKTSAEIIRQTIESVQKDIKETADFLDSKQKVLKETREKSATNLANLSNFEKKRESSTQKLAALNTDYEKLLLEYGFSDKQALEALFTSKMDADKTDHQIREHEKKCSVVKSRISELENIAGVSDFQQRIYEALTATHLQEKEELDAMKNKLTLLNQSLQELREKLVLKAELTQTFRKLETRLSYLKELDQLFKGSGFVKYVSRIYLKELCNTANLRFSRLTKNSLSLEIDDNNTFWVTDYLNGGKKRLLKTLSGGQTFQASLCLALALAEKVKSLNQADQSFFFLDEGFGALDRNSLRVVFETLKALRHENRIVGIISHVEELQQEVAVYAKVELDQEKGSQVSYSFS